MVKTLIENIDAQYPDKTIIAQAAKIIKQGGLVVFPTETVYGIAADSTNPKAIAKLNRIKKRPKKKPYTIQLAYKKNIVNYAHNISSQAKSSIKKHWPGALTAILHKKKSGKVGIRIPDHKVALALIKKTGRPIAAPSANISGRKSPKTARDAAQQLAGLVDLILDAGPAKYGKSSTVVDFTVTPPKILRQGALKIKFR